MARPIGCDDPVVATAVAGPGVTIAVSSDWPAATLDAAARVLGATERVPISGAHLVGAYHAGPANLALLQRISGAGWRVSVPTTLNATSADLSVRVATGPTGSLCRAERADARRVVDLLVALGCVPTLSCAPYFGARRPARGEICVWAESNAVLFANSVLGARVLRAPQYLDLACALLGEAPLAGTLLDRGRQPTVAVDCAALPQRWFSETAGFELLGLWLGERVGAGVPLLLGLPGDATETQLRSLCAAVGTASDCALLHVAGRTPESATAERYARETGLCADATRVMAADLLALHARLTGVEGAAVRTVAVGAPHASADQVRDLRATLAARPLRVQVLLSLGREVAADVAADLEALQRSGVRVVRDSCTYYGSFVGAQGGPAVTPSIKWAVYARANLGIDAWFGNALECQRALETGSFVPDRVFWRG